MNYLKGWGKLKIFIAKKTNVNTKVTIIVSVRNEQENIETLLTNLTRQNYSKAHFEIIIVDDDSDDETGLKVMNFVNKNRNNNDRIKLITIKEEYDHNFVAFKKRAIEKGIAASTGEWIVLTDADCTMGENWLTTIVSFIEEKEVCFISAPVCFSNEQSFFQKIQSLEFLSLIGIGAASLANKNPNMCNGANIAFRKSVFYEVGGYGGTKHLASGDDEFLMHKVYEKYPSGVAFLKNRDAIVSTTPFRMWKDFISQRRRWVSKSRKYQRKQVTATLYFVYIFHLMILVSGFVTIFNHEFLIPFIILMGVKLISEFIFVVSVSIFFKKQKYLAWYLIAGILYVFYVVIIGLLGNIGRYEWKGRRVR